MRRFATIISIGCLASPSICVAQTSNSAPTMQAQSLATLPSLSADDAVQFAIQHNPRLRAAYGDVAAARQGTRAAGALMNPTIAFTPVITGGVGGGSDTELLLQQSLELNGTRTARRRAGKARQRVTEAQAGVELRDLVSDTRIAYYELVRARAQAAVAHDLRNTAVELDAAAGKQVEAGARPAIEQTETAIELTRAGQQVTLAEAAVAARSAALNALLNRPPEAPIGEVGFPSTSGGTSGGVTSAATLLFPEEATRLALANRTELQAGAASIDAYRQDKRLAQAEGVPDIAPQYRATSVTHGVQQSGFGIGITLPFLDYGSRRSRVRQADESAHAQESRLEVTALQVRQEVAQALAQARAADAVLATFTDPQGGALLSQSRRLLDANRLGYTEGKTSIIALLEAQRTYRTVENDYINAQVAAALARTELERATGAFPVPTAFPRPTAASTPVPSPASDTAQKAP